MPKKLDRDQILSLIRTIIAEKDHAISTYVELIKQNTYPSGVVQRAEKLREQIAFKRCLELILNEIEYQENSDG